MNLLEVIRYMYTFMYMNSHLVLFIQVKNCPTILGLVEHLLLSAITLIKKDCVIF